MPRAAAGLRPAKPVVSGARRGPAVGSSRAAKRPATANIKLRTLTHTLTVACGQAAGNCQYTTREAVQATEFDTPALVFDSLFSLHGPAVPAAQATEFDVPLHALHTRPSGRRARVSTGRG